MLNKKKPSFPKDFFHQARPTVTNKETFKDVIPIKWSKEVLEGKRKITLYSVKEK